MGPESSGFNEVPEEIPGLCGPPHSTDNGRNLLGTDPTNRVFIRGIRDFKLINIQQFGIIIKTRIRLEMNDYLAFRFKDGSTARSLPELVAALRTAPRDVFEYHYRHLADWIESQFELRHLADDVRAIAASQLPLDLIRKYMIIEISDAIGGRSVVSTMPASLVPIISAAPISTQPPTDSPVPVTDPPLRAGDDEPDIQPDPSWEQTEHIRVWTKSKAPENVLSVMKNLGTISWIAYVPEAYRTMGLIDWMECVHYAPSLLTTIPMEHGNLCVGHEFDTSRELETSTSPEKIQMNLVGSKSS